jgi:Ca2+-binding RTX toxin-like protein
VQDGRKRLRTLNNSRHILRDRRALDDRLRFEGCSGAPGTGRPMSRRPATPGDSSRPMLWLMRYTTGESLPALVYSRVHEGAREKLRRATLLFAVIGTALIGVAAIFLNGGAEPGSTIAGDSHDNQLSGTLHPDTISGFDGNDQLEGGASKDAMYGGEGRDRMDGGAGDDRLYGGHDGDLALLGGPGLDRVDGGNGDDRLYGGDGSDGLYGGDGEDYLITGGGGGIGDGGPDEDELVGDYGRDRLDGGGSDDQVAGGSGTDRLEGSGGNDVLRGEEGDDSIFGEVGVDTMTGGNGDDFLYAVDGVPNETVDCGPGTNDSASVDAGDVALNCETLSEPARRKATDQKITHLADVLAFVGRHRVP